MARVLLIDDDERLLRTLSEVLREAGHEVAEAHDGKQAIRWLADESADLVVTDLYMPEMDGIEFLIRLHTECPDTPVIAMSGGGYMAKEELLRNAQMLGAVEILEKPFDANKLLEIVDRVLAGETD